MQCERPDKEMVNAIIHQRLPPLLRPTVSLRRALNFIPFSGPAYMLPTYWRFLPAAMV